jgi:plastocyanin
VDAEVELNRNRVRRTGVMTAVASFALVALTACGGGEQALEDVTRVPIASDAATQATREAASAPAATPGAEGEIPAAGATPGAAGDETATAAMSVDVVAKDIFFEPSEVTIPANSDVTVNLPNEGAAPHNFSIDELGIDVDIAPGATEQVVINAPAGEYEYYCNVPGHKEAGMVGTLIVSEDAAAAAPAENGTEPAATPAEAIAGEASPAAATPAAGGEEQAAAGAGAAEAVEVVSHDIFFEPDALTIPADTEVTVQLPNEGVTPHNFSIDELGIDVDIAPGATEETVINAPAGEYEYYCNVPGHKQAGMVGTLTVG